MYVATDNDTKNKWNELENALKNKRYFLNSQFDISKIYIENIPEISIEQEDKFYRARKNETGKEFTEKELHAPPLKKCNAGRLNPAGTRYLYIADAHKTAISEVRLWIGVRVKIAEYSPKERLMVLSTLVQQIVVDTILLFLIQIKRK